MQRIKKTNENNNLFQNEKGVHTVPTVPTTYHVYNSSIVYEKNIFFKFLNYLSYFYDWFLFSYFILNTVKLRVIIFLDFSFFLFKFTDN